MKGKGVPFFLFFVLLLAICSGVRARQDGVESGPEVKAFLDLCRHEEKELEFQIAHNEISRKDYTRAKNRIAIQRQMVLKRVKDTGEDIVPDLHVVTPVEVDQLIEDGLKAVKGAKAGAIISTKWLYHGSVNRGETYYIFERIKDLSKATRPRSATRNSPDGGMRKKP